MEYFRLEINPKEIGIAIDTNTRDNCKRNPHFKRLFNSMKAIALLSEKEHTMIGKAANDIVLFCEMNNIPCPFNPFNTEHISCIWEAIYEMYRPEQIGIKRTECVFFFADIEGCNYYRGYDTTMYNATICKVEIIEEYESFLGDMMWLENINQATATANDIKIAAEHFWNGDMTSKPMKEVLFQGKYKLVPLP